MENTPSSDLTHSEPAPPQLLSDPDACVDAVIDRVGRRIVLALPLGLGKPVRLANALYQRACEDPELDLHIVTAISLLAPAGTSSLEKRFMGPFAERLYGGVPELEYARAVVDHALPANVRVSEFFFKAGSFLHHSEQQQRYICTNYTHAVRDLLAVGVNVVCQMVSPSASGATGRLSLSCNPDLTLDLLPELRLRSQAGQAIALVAETNQHLPFMGNHAEVPGNSFDTILHRPSTDYPLFPVPQMAVSPADHLIGFYASSLLKDGGTLQVGIGSLGAALVHSTILRHRDNDAWQRVYRQLGIDSQFPVAAREGGTGPFTRGLYGCSEMMVDGFIHLLNAGVLTREVHDHAPLQELLNRDELDTKVSLETLDTLHRAELIDSPLRARDVDWLRSIGVLRPEVELRGGRLVEGEQSVEPVLGDDAVREALARDFLGERLSGGVVLHGGFYLGPADFYRQLRQMEPDQRAKLCMTSVNFINDLYDHRFGNQALKAAQRKDSRFINSAMMHTLSGAAVSDGLADGRVVSGVGGQYNFVAMAHELGGARSIITLRATREEAGRTVSNIVFNYGHCTIPRHLRDIVVTEYGIADLRGKSDEEVHLALIRIADSRFQSGLLKQARRAGKVAEFFRLPTAWCHNTPGSVQRALAEAGEGAFPAFPFGCDFTEQELVLGKALKTLKAATATRRGKLGVLLQALRQRPEPSLEPLLARMDLARPNSWREHLDQRLLAVGLHRIGEPSDAGS